MTSNKKILILTQIHPINISYLYDELCANFIDNNEIFSAQIMALLGEYSLKENENDFKHSYRVLNAAFVKNIQAAIDKMDSLVPWIIIGNCAKDTKIKFDHIIAFDGGKDYGDTEVFDRYIEADNKLLSEKNMQINYYKLSDAEYTFTNIEHLKLFLSTVGYKRKDAPNGNTI